VIAIFVLSARARKDVPPMRLAQSKALIVDFGEFRHGAAVE
jgi:hypothetical protein